MNRRVSGIYAALALLLASCSNVNLMDAIHGSIDPVIRTVKISAPDAVGSVNFGATCGVSADTIVVGDPNYNSSGSPDPHGDAYIYGSVAGHIEQIKDLDLHETVMDGGAGKSVAISGDFAVVGYTTGAGPAMKFFVRYHKSPATSSGWDSPLLATDTHLNNSSFAASVAIATDFAAAGVPGDLSEPGVVWGYNHSVGVQDEWAQDSSAFSWGGNADCFGTSLSASGSLLLVGAPGGVPTAGIPGSAVILQRGTDAFSPVKTLTASDGANDDFFGSSVGLSGDYAIVGAYGDDDIGSGSGSAYVFTKNQGGANAWGQQAKFTASDGAAGDAFGYSVAISGDTAVVGASNATVSGVASGCAYLYRLIGGTWTFLKKLEPSDPTAGIRFGYSVAISDTYVVVGAVPTVMGNPPAGYSRGAVYVYELR